MRPKDENKALAIEKALCELVYEQGLAGLKMNRVAQKAGIATGTLYTYYASKEALLVSSYEQIKGRALQSIAQDLLPDDAFPKRLRHMIKYYAKYLIANYKEAIFMDQFKRSPFHKEDLNLDNKPGYERLLFEMLAEGQEKEYLKKIPAHELLFALDGIIKNLVDLLFSTGQSGDEAYLDRVFQLSWDCIKA